jgi:hypothetical protein
MALCVSCGREADACWVSLRWLGGSDFWFSTHRRAGRMLMTEGPKVCFDIYRRRMERIAAPIRSDDQGDNSVIAAGQRLERCLSYDPGPDPFGKPKKDQKLSDYCSPSATRFDLCETKRGECR